MFPPLKLFAIASLKKLDRYLEIKYIFKEVLNYQTS